MSDTGSCTISDSSAILAAGAPASLPTVTIKLTAVLQGHPFSFSAVQLEDIDSAGLKANTSRGLPRFYCGRLCV